MSNIEFAFISTTFHTKELRLKTKLCWFSVFANTIDLANSMHVPLQYSGYGEGFGYGELQIMLMKLK